MKQMDETFCKSFPYEEYKTHVARLQRYMKESQCDALLLSTPENVYYATGYRTWYTASLFRPVFCVVPKEGDPAIILRILEKTTVQLYAWLPNENIYCWGTPTRNLGPLQATSVIDALHKIFDRVAPNTKTVGLEAGTGLNYYNSLTLLKEIIDEFSDKEFVDGSYAIQHARMVKTPWEISKIRECTKLTERAIDQTCRAIIPGKTTEKDVSRGIAQIMAAGGVDRISYLTVVSGDVKMKTFNAYATDRVIEKGDVVQLDISGHIDGYASDLSRVYVMGEATQEQKEMAQVAFDSVRVAVEAMKPGVPASTINRICEDYIANSKFGDFVIHSSGHCLGLNVVEFPTLCDETHTPLEEGMVFAVENGVYPFDLSIGAESIYASFRYEDQILVTKDGAEWLSGPAEPLIEVK